MQTLQIQDSVNATSCCCFFGFLLAQHWTFRSVDPAGQALTLSKEADVTNCGTRH